MTQPQSFKVCPQCQQPTALNAVLCSTCGRRFQSTAPPVNQTQVFSSGPLPTQPIYPQPPAAPTVQQVGGPRDQVEWMSSCIWTWVGLFFATTILCFELRLAFDTTVSDTTRGFAVLFALVLASICTALVHRLRRLYIYFAFRRYRWWIPAAIMVGLVGLMVFADHERRAEAYRRAYGYYNPPISDTRPPVSSPAWDSYNERQYITYPTPAPATTNRFPGVSGTGGSFSGGNRNFHGFSGGSVNGNRGGFNNAPSNRSGVNIEGALPGAVNDTRPQRNSGGFGGIGR